MTSWDTALRLVRERRVNPLLIGMVIEELERSIEELQEKRESAELSEVEEQVLRGFLVKRFLLIKKLRDYFRLQDFDDDHNIEKVVRRYCGDRSYCCHRRKTS